MIAALQLETSGAVEQPADNPAMRTFVGRYRSDDLFGPLSWDDLSPFVQGWVAAALWKVENLWVLTELEPDGGPPRVGPYWVAFRDLAPETLARIIADCQTAEALQAFRDGVAYDGHHGGGAAFRDQQAGKLERHGLAPVRAVLESDGKVRFQ